MPDLRVCYGIRSMPTTLTRVAPLGLGCGVVYAFYKHAAPLGLNARMRKIQDIASIVGAWYLHRTG